MIGETRLVAMGYSGLTQMSVVRALSVLLITFLPSYAATFGTVVAHPQPLADLALDEARKRLYVVNTAQNTVEVYSTTTNPPRLTNSIKTDATPLSIAMARSGRFLYAACYGASSLEIIDLFDVLFDAVGDAARKPRSGRGRFRRTRFDQHDRDGNRRIGAADIRPRRGCGTCARIDCDRSGRPGSGAAAAEWSDGVGRARPAAGQRDGRTIIGAHMLANNTRTVFVYDVNSSTVLRSRNVPAISSVLAVSPDGSQFVSGPFVFETSTMAVLAQQSAVNAPFVFPAGTNFTTQTTQGGAVYAQTMLGPALITGYNVVPVQTPAARSNTSELLFNTPDSLLIQLGIQIPETQSGRMVATSDGAMIYAISQSGFLVLPIGTLAQSPIALPDSNVALLASDQCGVTAALNSAVIPVRDVGRRPNDGDRAGAGHVRDGGRDAGDRAAVRRRRDSVVQRRRRRGRWARRRPTSC